MTTKNYIHILMLLLTGMYFLISCAKNDSKIPDEIQTAESGYMAAEKDMKLTYTTTEGDGLGASYLWRVTDVEDSSGYKVASSELMFDLGITVHSQAKYNKEKTTVLGSDMPAVYYKLLDEMKEQYNVSFTHKERPIITVIPHRNPLNTIVSGNSTVAEWHGIGRDDDTKITHDYTVEQSDAVIDKLDHIAIGIGEFDCLRIRYTRTATNKMVITSNGS